MHIFSPSLVVNLQHTGEEIHETKVAMYVFFYTTIQQNLSCEAFNFVFQIVVQTLLHLFNCNVFALETHDKKCSMFLVMPSNRVGQICLMQAQV